MRRTFNASSPTSFFRPTSRKGRRARQRNFRPLPIRLEERTLLSTVSWINPSGGDWDTPSNWSTGALPGPSDDVVINQPGITVTHSTSAIDTVNSLTISSSQSSLDISGGSLALSTTSSIAGTVSIEGATLTTAGNLAVAGPFTNNGSVEVQAGTLNLSVGAPSHPTDAAGTGTVTGTFTGAAGTTMGLRYQDMAATGDISGDVVGVSGIVRCPIDVSGTAYIGAGFTNPHTNLANIVGGGDFSTGGTITTGNLTLSSNRLSGTDSFVVNGSLTTAQSTIANDGTAPLTIDVYGGIAWQGGNGALDGVTLKNHATCTLTGPFSQRILDGAVFDNLAGATVLDQSSNGSFFGNQGANGEFINGGTYVKSGSGTMGIGAPFLNTGAVDVQAGDLELLVGGTNSGVVTIESGATLGGSAYTQTAGATVLNGGTLNGGPFLINAGSLSGSGTINAYVSNAGQVIPGGTRAAGLITINGSYTQTTTGALDIDIGGTTAGSQYDQLAVSGTASLGGTLNIAVINGFQPALGNAFQVLTFSSSNGDFGAYNGLGVGNCLILGHTVNSTNVTLTVQADHPPVVGAISAPISPTIINTAVTASAPFTDPDTFETHTAVWDWGDGTTSAGSVTESNGSGSVAGTHVYTVDGVYTVKLTDTDSDGCPSNQAAFQYVVIYDPSAGFVTGGGWITSPPGAYAANPSLTGKATFGFVSKYQKGANVPSGDTQFQFQTAGFNFHSTSYDWLVVAGAKAQFKGSGTVNGAGNDGFMLTAIDGELPGGGGTDKFRIKVWDKTTGNIIYDNQMGASDTADPTTAIGGGDIVIHASSDALQAAGGPAAGGTDSAPLTPRALHRLVDEAIALWHAAGVGEARLAALRHVAVRIDDLPDPDLGLAAAGTIWLDRGAAGHGWYVDPASTHDGRSGRIAAATARGRVDLLAVLDHEMGHLLGLDHEATGVMAEALAPGVREYPRARDISRDKLAPAVVASSARRATPRALREGHALPREAGEMIRSGPKPRLAPAARTKPGIERP
jgi:hypothetical protein